MTFHSWQGTHSDMKLKTTLKSTEVCLEWVSDVQGSLRSFKAGSLITLSLHCDSQTCYRQKPAAKLFGELLKANTCLWLNIKPSSKHTGVFGVCWEQGRIQGSRKRPGGQEQKPVPQERNFTGLEGAMTSELFTPSHKVNTHLSKAASRPQTTALKYP